MSFVIAVPEFLSAAATDLANLGSTISAANAAASIPTTGVLAAGADDVSAASPASRASPVDIVAAGPSAPRRLLEQLPSVTGPVEALARVEFCGQGVDLIAELG
ncbi:PE-PGRS family protein [Mycobacterium tuberculosis]|nr:PE family protein [Mycobacterium tuberculosis]SHB14100.1 PE-PGRS family protein [Mycobacterium tuberculosis]